MSDHSMTSNEANIVAQLWIAFGRGAHELPISAAAVEGLIEAYRERWPDIFDAWPAQADQIVAAAEVLGRTCVEVVRVSDGRIIELPIIEEARRFIPCPCDGPDMKKP